MNNYEHGGDIYAYSEGVNDYSSNINPLGPPLAVREVYENALASCAVYPDPLCRKLRNKIAFYEGVSPEQIACGNGAADLIHRIVIWRKPKRSLVLVPGFSEYERALKLHGCEVYRYYLCEESGFEVQENLLDALEGMDMIFICNPANPVGNVTERGLMARIVEIAKSNNTLLVVDECFLDFLPERASLTAMPFLAGGNVVLLKAFTKIYAMPGLRLGYCITADPSTAAGITASGQAWPVSSPAQACGIAALGDEQYIAKTQNLIANERERMKAALAGLGFKTYNSRANFVFVRHENSNLKEMLLQRGILIRDCRNYPALGEGYYRFAVKGEGDNSQLIACLEALLK